MHLKIPELAEVGDTICVKIPDGIFRPDLHCVCQEYRRSVSWVQIVRVSRSCHCGMDENVESCKTGAMMMLMMDRRELTTLFVGDRQLWRRMDICS